MAAPDLVARGSISGLYGDLAVATAPALENGVAGNRLGGLGSGLAYAGGNTFLAVPDRGPNAVPYNSAVDDTASYINRFQTLRLQLAPSDPGAALPLTLSPFLVNTTLFSSLMPLVYGNGATAGLAGGAPALNATNHLYYFTGRSDNFDPAQNSLDPRDARLDPESVRASSDGRSVFVSDEYGPYVYQFDRATGIRVQAFKLPDNLAITNLSAQGATEISGNTAGRVANKGMEGLALTPDGRTLVGMMQSPLLQDGGTNAGINRIVTLDLRSGATHEYAYPLTNTGTASKPKYGSVSDIVAINNHQFLVDERDGKGLGDNSTAAFKRFFVIDLAGATDVGALTGEAALTPNAVGKTLFVDLVSILNAHGVAAQDIPAKIEGLAFGPDVQVKGTTLHTLFVANDNDFIGTVTDSNHPNGIDNPNQFFVLGFTDADLPGYVPQKFLNGGSLACPSPLLSPLRQPDRSASGAVEAD